jgi:hypothetical protein
MHFRPRIPTIKKSLGTEEKVRRCGSSKYIPARILHGGREADFLIEIAAWRTRTWKVFVGYWRTIIKVAHRGTGKPEVTNVGVPS